MARRRRNPEVIAGRVNADGTIAAGDGFSSRRTVAGRFTITCPNGFKVLSATASPLTVTSVVAASPVAFTENTFEVWTYNGTNVLADVAFAFTAVGVQQ